MLTNIKDYLLLGTGLFIVLLVAFYQIKIRIIESESERAAVKIEQLKEMIAEQDAAIEELKKESEKQKLKLKSAESAAANYRKLSDKQVNKTMKTDVSKNCIEAIDWAIKYSKDLHHSPSSSRNLRD